MSNVLSQSRVSAMGLLPALAACSEVKPYRLQPGKLFLDGKPVGQPYMSRMTSIRMVKMESVQEADRFFVALCRNKSSVSDDRMRYTHEMPSHTQEIGILYISDSLINAQGIREVHFVKTIEPKQHHKTKEK